MTQGHKITVVLEEQDLLEIQRIAIDEDAEAALRFVLDRLTPCLPRKGSAPCDSSRLNPYLIGHGE